MAARFSVTSKDEESNLIVLRKGSECYVYLFSDANKQEVLRELGRDACDPGLSLNWYDAAVLSNGVRRLVP